MPTTETRRLNPYLLWGIFLAVILLVFILVHAFTREDVEVRVAPVTRQNVIATTPTNGKVEPVNEFQAHAPAPGVVGKLYVKVGQQVKAGDLLVTMNNSDAAARLAAANTQLSTAQAAMHNMEQGGSQAERLDLSSQLDRARMQQAQASKSLTALEQLQAKGAASASEVAAAHERLQSASSTVENLQLRGTESYSPADQARVRAQLADARAAVAAAQTGYADANIRAPFPGTVYSVPVSQYDFVSAGEDLLDLADLNKIQIRAYFDEPEIGKLAVGQPVSIEWDAKPLQRWHGHISIAPTTVITYGTRNVGECLITVDDAHGDLLPNTNVTVTVTTSQRFNVLSVPREALHANNGDFVFRIVNGKLVRTPVVVGVVNLTRVEIVSGLSENDTVALSSISNRELTNGLAVKAVE
ncbi:macrolide-specific efflux protein MacA [Edaphobacter acidisoli]|uniref:Macrolide-specific efflux protein MacA n=1 Tax=Edaphobacter acidisoli TaxID=2040573 RepID=A0A916W0Q7_9BACT|nr:efflux RND transporter periplasmic adaptor subunit [Edaphobacter acidisoli]GGA56955.1 macrolide-specific efflux protein MacA [Edaphobacter acidisoli]